MKKTIYLTFAIAVLLLCTNAQAQFAYSFTTFTKPYVPLVNGTSINNNRIWRGDSAYFAVSPGFNFKLDSIDCMLAYFSGGNTFTSSPSQVIQSGFNVSEVNFIDRGAIDSIPKSPVRIDVQGTIGNRILKIEAYNIGFLPEFLQMHTLNDSASVQMWLYEKDNSVEIHYGPSHITNAPLYFTYGKGPLVFYIQDNEVSATQNGPIYVLAGNAWSPVVEANYIADGHLQNMVIPLRSWPADSTVYRFSLNKASVPGNPTAGDIKIYPTCAYDDIRVTVNGNYQTGYCIVSVNGAATGIAGVLNNNGSTHIDIRTLPQGVYLLVMQDDKIKNVQKFVKL